ncbi:RusA family crossover junction endodeoxyribonuclease [Mesorhizobium sp. WSM4303]|uniref:RusA family crossover junction endodeoxyribonuclease n=1 Tax=Mesorhizobium sp. WSM4303 TaxID=2589887 RepID=UPI00115D6FC9|nr:RusA family crossover junction endodeoxyribonuclease [Mesorhizobium sp. WSM4303]TRD03815.1 RusA family crossover junction endodeoxyribonuclease [Mesorhizobium sp. WSM4303]
MTTHLSAAEERTGMVRIEISQMPPSANAMRSHFIAGGKVQSVKSKPYAAWKDATAWEIAAARPGKIAGPYRLYIAVQRDWRSKRARDIDNIIKPTSDALVAAGVVSDDSLAEEVNAKWADNLGGPAVVVLICRAEEQMAA